jgi:hypothetical protein
MLHESYSGQILYSLTGMHPPCSVYFRKPARLTRSRTKRSSRRHSTIRHITYRQTVVLGIWREFQFQFVFNQTSRMGKEFIGRRLHHLNHECLTLHPLHSTTFHGCIAYRTSYSDYRLYCSNDTTTGTRCDGCVLTTVHVAGKQSIFCASVCRSQLCINSQPPASKEQTAIRKSTPQPSGAQISVLLYSFQAHACVTLSFSFPHTDERWLLEVLRVLLPLPWPLPLWVLLLQARRLFGLR